ncbi:MAG: hypothetical protein AB1757_15775 [Acidobacteriota bacterium]
MKNEGPQLEALTRRLSECPADFLGEPKTANGKGQVEVSAIVFDLIRELGGKPLTKQQLDSLKISNPKSKEERNRLRLALIASWLFYDAWFRSREGFADKALEFLLNGLGELANLVDPTQFISDADRREELARLSLKQFGLRPLGESEAQAQDRLTTLDSVERARVIKAAREAEERARQIREEMRRKAEEEAAASWGRE